MMAKGLFRKIVFISVCILFVLTFIPFSYADELADIKSAIQAKGLKWIAGETSMSKLSPLERKMRLGHIKEGVKSGENQITDASALEAAPTGFFDWRSKNGMNYVTPVKDQGNCGSCWAFGTAGAAESCMLISNNLTWDQWKLDLSEQTLVSCSRAGSCGGGYISKASNYIRDYGLPEESCFSYTASNNNCNNACATYQTETHKIGGWSWVTASTAAIKNALYTYGPLVISMQVYEDFDFYTSGIYEYAYGNLRGGHAILLVGYDDTNSCFIVKNSWGPAWGEDGYFRIAYTELSEPVYFGLNTIAYYPAGPVCTYAVSPTSQTLAATGGAGSFTVVASADCAWTAVSSNSSWIIIDSGSSGSGNGTVNYHVTANPNRKVRTGYIYIKDAAQSTKATFTVKQQRR